MTLSLPACAKPYSSFFAASIAGLLLLFVSGSASAAPFLLTGTGVLDGNTFVGPGANIDVPGTSFGDTMTLSVIVDNGSSSLTSQSWDENDVVSSSLTVGTYSAVYNAPGFQGVLFTTDTLGALANTFFTVCCGGDTGGTDTFGTSSSVQLYANAFFDSQGRSSFYTVWHIYAENWTISAVNSSPVPAPGALALLGLGLIGLGFRQSRT